MKFPSAQRSPFPINDTVWAHLYLPAGADKPACVLLLPVMAAPNLWIETRFINRLVANGLAVLLVEMPYQFHRSPGTLIPSGEVFLARSPKRMAANFRQSIADARRALDWLEASEYVDSKRIGVLGISLGAIVGSMVLSQDNRPRGGILLLGGADFPSLVVNSVMTRDVVWHSHLKIPEMRRAWKGIEPGEYREKNRGKNVFLINVHSDAIIQAENARKLKEAFPDAEQWWLPLGHYTAMLHIVWVPSYIAWKFKRILGGRAEDGAGNRAATGCRSGP